MYLFGLPIENKYLFITISLIVFYSFILYKEGSVYIVSLSLSLSLSGLGGLQNWENPDLKFNPLPVLGSISQITISLPWTSKLPILWKEKNKNIFYCSMISLSTYLSMAVGLLVYTIASREPKFVIAMR